MAEDVYTVGHSTHPVEKLIDLLKKHEITAVADVRSKPYSRMNPQFNREAFKSDLRHENIAYVFLGKELGARSEDKSCYCNGRVQYDLLAKTDLFQAGLQRIKDGSKKYRIALMCAEKDPLHCHRTILVARHLIGDGIPIHHILANGTIEEHQDAMERLAGNLRLRSSDMFQSYKEIEETAYRIQGEAIAYQETVEPQRHAKDYF